MLLLRAFVLTLGLVVQIAVAQSERTLEKQPVFTGTLAEYHYVKPTDGTVSSSTVLLLSAPADVSLPDGHTLNGVLLVELVPHDDALLIQFGRLLGKRVNVRCTLGTATLWGFRHASCVPVTVETAI